MTPEVSRSAGGPSGTPCPTRSSIPRPGGHAHVAFVLARSGYSATELDAIWDREIVPECAWNLMQVTGEWALFVVDEEALAERADGRRPLTERALGKEPPSFLAEQWAAIKELRAMLLALPDEAAQRARAAMWTAFVHVYLEASLEKVMFLESHVKSLRATGADQALLLEAFDAVRPVLRSLLLDDERADRSGALATCVSSSCGPRHENRSRERSSS